MEPRVGGLPTRVHRPVGERGLTVLVMAAVSDGGVGLMATMGGTAHGSRAHRGPEQAPGPKSRGVISSSGRPRGQRRHIHMHSGEGVGGYAGSEGGGRGSVSSATALGSGTNERAQGPGPHSAPFAPSNWRSGRPRRNLHRDSEESVVSSDGGIRDRCSEKRTCAVRPGDRTGGRHDFRVARPTAAELYHSMSPQAVTQLIPGAGAQRRKVVQGLDWGRNGTERGEGFIHVYGRGRGRNSTGGGGRTATMETKTPTTTTVSTTRKARTKETRTTLTKAARKQTVGTTDRTDTTDTTLATTWTNQPTRANRFECLSFADDNDNDEPLGTTAA